MPNRIKNYVNVNFLVDFFILQKQTNTPISNFQPISLIKFFLYKKLLVLGALEYGLGPKQPRLAILGT